MNNELTIVIVTYNPGPEFDECLSALDDHADARVIVWDNSSNQRALQEKLAARPYIQRHGDGINYGFGGGANRAVRAMTSPTEFVLFLNPDCILESSTSRILLKRMQRSQRTAIAAPLMRYASGDYGIAGGTFPNILKEIVSDLGLYSRMPMPARKFALAAYDLLQMSIGRGMKASANRGEDIEVDWVSGFCMMVRLSDFISLGGFSDAYFLYFEDVDLCRRMNSIGRSVLLVRDTEALHYESTSMSTTGPLSKSAHYAKARVNYYRLHGSRMELRVAEALEARIARRAKRHEMSQR